MFVACDFVRGTVGPLHKSVVNPIRKQPVQRGKVHGKGKHCPATLMEPVGRCLERRCSHGSSRRCRCGRTGNMVHALLWIVNADCAAINTESRSREDCHEYQDPACRTHQGN